MTIPQAASAWRVTIQGLREQFRQAAEQYPDLRHAVIQALDRPQTIPPGLEAMMQAAGGWSVGELRGRWDIVEDKELSVSLLDWLTLNAPAKTGYLFGDEAARGRFEQLAERAWLALPGTRDGKAQAYPQPRLPDRWMAFLYEQLARTPSSYFAVEEELWVLDCAAAGGHGRPVEQRYASQAVKQGGMVSRGYPDTPSLSSTAQRWVCSILATDPFTISCVAVDQLLAHPDPAGPRLVSWQEMDAFQKSPAFQNANHLIDLISLANGKVFPIYRRDCKLVPGNTPSICPSAEPKPPTRLRPDGVMMADIELRFRQLHFVGDGETIHWVGHQGTVETTCVCHLTDSHEGPGRPSDGIVTVTEKTDHTLAGRASKVIKVLLLSANPLDVPLSIEEEFRAIDAKIRAADHRDHIQLIPHGAVRLDDIAGLLMRHKPHVVHFSGHGAESGIALIGPDGAARLVPPDALAHILRALKDNVRVVVLNACDSALQAEAIVSEIDCAVGMSDEIDDGEAIAFAAAFYEALGYGQSVQTAFDLAVVLLTGAGADRSLATLHKRRGAKPAEIILVNPLRPQ